MFNDPFNQLITLSGLYTSSVFSILLDHEIARSKRYPSPLSILLISICKPAPLTPEIRESAELMVAKILKTKLRLTDISSQYKEDFLVLLTNTDESGAGIAAHRLLDSLNSKFTTQKDEFVELGVCASLASHPGGSQVSADFLLMKVMQSLQEARTKGPGALVNANV